MLTKAQIKFVQSLQLKKNREKQGLFIAEGEKMVEELLSSEIKIREIYSSRNFQHSIFSNHIEVIRITEAELKKISSLASPNQVLAVCEIPRYDIDAIPLQQSLTLMLDNLQDPGNLGTLIRIADWFGIRHLICSPDTVEVYNPKVVQATMGSVARVQVHYTPLPTFLEGVRAKSPSLNIYGALLDGQNIYEKKLNDKGIIVIGNESKGISEELFPFITERIKIPSFAQQSNSAESLNAAVAGALICAEFRRQIGE